MKNIRKYISVILIVCMVSVFASCGKKSESETTVGQQVDVVVQQSDVPVVSDGNTVTYTNEALQETMVVTSQTATTSAQETIAPTVTSAQAEITTSPQVESTASTIIATGTSKYTNNSLAVEQVVFYPNQLVNENKKYPVVVWANGTGCPYSMYEGLLSQIAENGYIVVANGETMAADGTTQRESIDFIISENSNPDSVIYKKVNTGKIAAAGHSQGGRSAVNAASADGRIACVYSLAGSNYDYEAEKLSAPAFFVTGTSDVIVSSKSWVKPAYDICKGPAVYVSLSGGVHTTCVSDPGKYTSYAVDWFDIWLKGDNGKKDIFRSGGTLSADSAWVDFQSKGI